MVHDRRSTVSPDIDEKARAAATAATAEIDLDHLCVPASDEIIPPGCVPEDEVLDQVQDLESSDEVLDQVQDLESSDEVLDQVQDLENSDEVLDRVQDSERPDELFDQLQGRMVVIVLEKLKPQVKHRRKRKHSPPSTPTPPKIETEVPKFDWSAVPFPPFEVEQGPDPPRKSKKWNISTTSTTFSPPLRSPYRLYTYQKDRIHYGQYPREESSPTSSGIIEKMENLSLGLKPHSDKILWLASYMLPIELWLEIFDMITSTGDLLAMCRTCKFFYAYGIPRLYQSVRVRLPFWTSEPGLNFGSYFDNGRIPFNLFISPPGGIIGAELGKYPKICELGEYVKHLELSGTWDVSARSHNFVGVPETIRHNLVVYDIWKAKDLEGYIQLWVGTHIGGRAPQNIFTALAGVLNQMKHLQSFSYLPRRSLLQAAPVDVILGRGWVLPHNRASIPRNVWGALKGLRKLKELTMDFEQSEHLVYTRVGLVEVVDYDPRISGLVGFKNLVKLDVRGVCDNRIKEIGRVISDCIKSGTLRNVNIEIEKYWSYAMEEFELSEDMDLWDWVSGIWERTIGCGKKSGKKRKGISAPTIDVSISLDKVDWRFRTCNDYNIRTDCLTELSIHTGFLYDETLRLMTRLPVGGLPNLRKLLLKCFLNDCYELLKHTTGLEELYIINPAPIERMVAQTKDIQRQRLVAYEENRIQQPDIKKMNWILDTIAKHHLRTLEVLVIDEPIPVPRSWEAIGTINSLELWKGRGMKMKELGLSLYGPQERVSEFLGCFPRLKYLHNFMTPFSFGIQPVLGAPPAFQVTCQECFNHSAYFCNASNTAALISHAWAKELIRGRDNDKHVVGEPTRWIAIGPWWITQEAGQRWRWDEDNANRLLEWKDRPVFYGDLNAWDPQGGLGIAESPWSESRMWWALDRYLW